MTLHICDIAPPLHLHGLLDAEEALLLQPLSAGLHLVVLVDDVIPARWGMENRRGWRIGEDGEHKRIDLPGSDGHKVSIVGWGRYGDTPGAPVVWYGMVWYGTCHIPYSDKIVNRPGVAKAVLQTALSLINYPFSPNLHNIIHPNGKS